MTQALIIMFVAFGATLLSSMAGGGSNMIVTPVWLMLGFPLPVAMATNTACGSIWTLVAARNYLRGHQVDWPLVGGLVGFGLAGAFIGAQIIMHCNPKAVQRFIGLIIMTLALYAFFKKDFGLESAPPKISRTLTSLTGFPLGFYEAFFGSGNGIFVSAILTKARGFVLLQALGYSYVLAFVWCLFAAAIYISGGHWNLSLMVPAAVGSFCGGTCGSHIGAKRGSKFVKALFVTIGSVLGLRLLLGY